MRRLLPLVLTSLLTACSILRFSHPDLSAISVGMTKAEVVHALGKPDRVAVHDGVEVLSYGWNDPYDAIIGLAWVNVALRDGRVVGYGDHEATSGTVVSYNPPPLQHMVQTNCTTDRFGNTRCSTW